MKLSVDPIVSVTFPIEKSELQKKLESNGCRLYGQDLLTRHQSDNKKPCVCGRPVLGARE